MKLTAKQQRFAELVAIDGMTQADAYREAYSAGNMKPETIWRKAAEVADHAGVSAQIAELTAEMQSKAVEKELWSRVDSIEVLKEIATDQEARGNEKVSAVKELNAMHGFSTSKLEVSGSVQLQAEIEVFKRHQTAYEELTEGQKCNAHIASIQRHMQDVSDDLAEDLVGLVRDISRAVAGTKSRGDLVRLCQQVLTDLEGFEFD